MDVALAFGELFLHGFNAIMGILSRNQVHLVRAIAAIAVFQLFWTFFLVGWYFMTHHFLTTAMGTISFAKKAYFLML